MDTIITILLVSLIAILVRLIVLHYKAIKKIKEKEKEINKLSNELSISKEEHHQEVAHLERQVITATCNYQNLQDEYCLLEERYRRIQLLYPLADAEVSEMLKQEHIEE